MSEFESEGRGLTDSYCWNARQESYSYCAPSLSRMESTVPVHEE